MVYKKNKHINIMIGKICKYNSFVFHWIEIVINMLIFSLFVD